MGIIKAGTFEGQLLVILLCVPEICRNVLFDYAKLFADFCECGDSFVQVLCLVAC